MQTLTLRNGIQMPILGYGVYRVSHEETEQCVLDALATGFRHIDTAQAYQLVKGTEKAELPQVKPLDQKQILLSLLPEEFESKKLVEEAKSQGLTERTAFRWNDEWQQTGIVLKIRHGVYKKILGVA